MLLAALFAITAAGPGTAALDEGHAGTGWALAEFAAGVLGAEAFLHLAAGRPEPDQPAAPSTNGATREPEPATA